MSEAGKTLFIDYAKCIGCETCEAVCGFLYDRPRIVMIRTVDGFMAPLYCKHCEHAHCMKVCKRGALQRDRDGAVLLDPMLCRGCETRSCVLGCPYAAFFATDRGVAVRKCDLCASRRNLGMEPACAEMCPCGAIMYVDKDDVEGLETDASREAREKVMAHIRPPSARKTGE